MNIIAKNRDRAYKPYIDIIHEIVNGVEIVYIHDRTNLWVEGMNEYGTGIVNSTLSIHDGKITTKKRVLETNKKRNVIYKILTKKNYKTNLEDIFNNSNRKNVLEGHSILVHDNENEIFHIENNIENQYVIKKIDKPSVYTNHGIILQDEGFTEGRKGLSSCLRQRIIESELKNTNIKSIEDLVAIMNKNYMNVDPRFQPYRDKNTTIKTLRNVNRKQHFISTSGQLIMNLTNREFIYYADKNNSKTVKYINKLPNNYVPKIKVIIEKTEKQRKQTRIAISKIMKTCKNKTCKNINK
jgi:hypothetical protein